MGRFLRFVFGALLILGAVSLGLRYGEPTYLSHVGRLADVTVAAPCTVDQFLTVDKATRCHGTWTDGGTNHSGTVIAANRPTVGTSIPAHVLAGRAFVRPAGTSLLLGYASIPLGLVGLYLVLKGPRRRRQSGGTHTDSNYDSYGYDDSGTDYRDDDQPQDSGDSGGDGGGDSGSD